MTCQCGGKFGWKCQDKVMSDDPSHKIRVNVFLCKECGRCLVIDVLKKQVRNKGKNGSRNLPKPEIYIPTMTVDEKKIFEKHKLSDKELAKYMKDIKKHTKKIYNEMS